MEVEHSEEAEPPGDPQPSVDGSAEQPGSSETEPPEGEELFFALVYPVGTDSTSVVDTITEALVDVNYDSDPPLHLIEELEGTTYGQAEMERIRRAFEEKKEYPDAPEYFRTYMQLMDLGNALRADVEPGAMGLFAASRILRRRLGNPPADQVIDSTPPLTTVKHRYSYLIRSLKVPEEIARLRNIYGDALIVVAVHSNEEDRRKNLTWKIRDSAKKAAAPDDFRPYADTLIARDYREGRKVSGQQLSEAFPLADVFVDATHQQRLEDSIKRFVEILFRHRFRTPTEDEYGMFHAYGAALRSADLSRQVGAAIADDDGEIIALGTNEVPKAGGGQYWPDDRDRDDGRDFTSRRDMSTEIKKSALDQLLGMLSGEGHLTAPLVSADVWEQLEGSDFMNVGEFGRATHAEMAAIVHAARRGRSIQGSTLYTTTFPCHVCARHVIQAGIARVVFNEPYPKSWAAHLHGDSIALGGPRHPHRVLFEPFVGVSPALYAQLFRVPRGTRRTDGEVSVWPRREARSNRAADPNSYLPKEVEALTKLRDGLRASGKPEV